MFEHSLYEPKPETAPPAPPEHLTSQEGDLFHRYEIKNWDLSPRIFKILGIAALFNVLLVFVAGQGAFLTMKGCDSPLVGGVCQVLDTVYVSAMVYGTDSEYVDEPYDQTDLENAEVTFVDVSGVEEPMTYPVSYVDATTGETVPMFPQEAPPPEMAYTDPGYVAPGIPTTTPYTAPPLIDTPQTLPRQNDTVVDGTLPNGFGGINSNPTIRKGGRGGRVKPPLGDEDPTAIGGDEKKPADNPTVKPEPAPKPEDAVADKNGIFINKRPLRLKAEETIKQIDAKLVKLDAPFSVSIAGTLGLAKDGKTIVLKNPKAIPPPPGQKNDPIMEKLVRDWILAVGDAGWFGYLETLDVSKKPSTKRVVVTVIQNDADFVATIKAEKPDENNAKTASSVLGAFLVGGRLTLEGDELAFVNSASTTTEGNVLVLNVRIPKAQVQEMIQRKLAESTTDKKPENGNSAGSTASNTAQK
jgi:hypothetical protein